MERQNDIVKELQEIAPTLSSLPKHNFYSVPENYFAGFKAAMLQEVKRKEVQHELSAIAPELAELDKKRLTEVPINYFEAFPQQMLKKITEQKAEALPAGGSKSVFEELLQKVAGILFKPRYAFALAGTASILIIGIMLLFKVEQCTDLECKMAALTDEEITGYLNDDTYIYSEDIFEAAGDEMIPGADKNKINAAYNDLMTDISNEELDRALLN